jgi:hypothetical protein
LPPHDASITRIAPLGWSGLSDADTFYPDDLPGDWQLTYFANAFGAVLLPVEQWTAAGPDAAAWRDDVHGGFRFYLEDAPDRRAALAALSSGLGDALDAVIGTLRGGAGVRSCHAPGIPDGPAIGYAVAAPDSARGDLRAARRWLQGLAAEHRAPPRLVILARPTAHELSAWHQLVALLGLGP